MNLKRKPDSTVGTGSGPVAQRRRNNVPANEEPKRTAGLQGTYDRA